METDNTENINNINAKDNKSSKNLDKGHRERLRKSIVKNPDDIDKEKILECFLYNSIPRKDLRIISKMMLEKSNGNFKDLINKDYNYLVNHLGLTMNVACFVLVLKKMVSFINEEELEEKLNSKKFDTRKSIIEFVKKEIGSKDTECIMAIFLAPNQTLIEKISYGSNNNNFVNFDFGNIINSALNNKCKYIILAHNHPSNNVKPSQEDISLTLKFESTIHSINKFELIDHIIVSNNNYFSFYENNLLISKSNNNIKIKNITKSNNKGKK